MRQALIIADSAGSPRGAPLLTPYRATWVSLVEDFLLTQGIKAFAYTERALTTESLMRRCELQLRYYEPTLVIFQIGMGDCANRVLTDQEKRYLDLLRQIPAGGRVANWFIRRYGERLRARNLTEIESERTEANVRRLLRFFPNCHKFFIPIELASAEYAAKVNGIQDRHDRYNAALRRALNEDCTFIDAYFDAARPRLGSIYCADHQHLNFDGHRLIADLVIDAIASQMPAPFRCEMVSAGDRGAP
jgi:lysophospholipase L1-like esterase